MVSNWFKDTATAPLFYERETLFLPHSLFNILKRRELPMTTPTALVKNITDALLAQLNAAKTAVDYAALESSAIPTQIKLFALAALNDVARDTVLQFSAPMFRLDHVPLSLKHSFADALAQTALLTDAHLNTILQPSVRLTHDLLVMPHQTITAIVFGESDEQPSDVIVKKLESIIEYRYLVDVFLQYLIKRQTPSLTREKAQRLIGEIDRRLSASYACDDTMQLFQPMYNFYTLGGEKEISIDMLMSFANDKGLQPLASLLSELRVKGAGALSISDIDKAVRGESDMLLRQLTPLPVAPKPSSASFETALLREVEVQLAAASATGALEADPVPPDGSRNSTKAISSDEETVAQNVAPDTSQIKPFVFETTENADGLKPSEHSGDEKPLSMPTTAPSKLPPIAPKRREEPPPLTQYLPPPPQLNSDGELEDLRVLIDDETRKKMIRRLFKGNEQNYDAAIADLNQKKTWRESSLYIDEEIFTQYKVDEYSLEAVQFTDIVFARFHRKP
jgi:hypothetical protein